MIYSIFNCCKVNKINTIKHLSCALAGVAQGTECWPVNQKVAGSIPSQGTCLGCSLDPGWECARGS